MTKKTRLISYLRELGFEIEFQQDKIICTHGQDMLVFKRKRLSEIHYRAIKMQLEHQGYDVQDYESDFLEKPVKKTKPFEIQYDTKPQGAVIRINTADGCVLRICRIPKELVFDEYGEVRQFVDITYPK